jgi:phosphoglycerate dehydrogenase-like enzyme
MPPRIVLASAPILYGFMDTVQSALEHKKFAITRILGREEYLNSAAAIEDADVLYVDGHLPTTRDFLRHGKKLRAVIAPTTGVEGIDIAGASSLNILVGNAQFPENYESMAEAAIMLMLVSMFNLRESEALLRENRPRPASPPARMLKNKTIGLIGLGKIARAVVERLRNWNLRIVVSVARPPSSLPPDVELVTIDDLLRQSDVIVVLAALNAETNGLLSYERLKTTKPDSILINVARGGILVENDLCDLVSGGHFSQVALDVFDEEPLGPENPLRALPRTILTPHIVGHTRDSFEIFPKVGLENLFNVLSGKPPLYLRNPEILQDWLAKWETRSLIGPAELSSEKAGSDHPS